MGDYTMTGKEISRS